MDRETLLEAYLPEEIDNPPEAYFESMRMLRPEPPDEETVERIVETARRIWRKQEQKELAEQEGVPPLRWGPCGAGTRPGAKGASPRHRAKLVAGWLWDLPVWVFRAKLQVC